MDTPQEHPEAGGEIATTADQSASSPSTPAVAASGSTPPWVLKAWTQYAKDVLGIITFDLATESPKNVGKCLALFQYAVNQLRENQLNDDGTLTSSVEKALSLANGLSLCVVLEHLSSNSQRSAEVMESYAHHKKTIATKGDESIFKGTAPVYFFLIVNWQEVEKCESSAEVFRMLEDRGVEVEGGWESVRAILRRIGKSYPIGRPSKS